MNTLPIDCDAWYDPDFLGPEDAAALFAEITGGYDVTNKVVPMADGTEFIAETAVFLFADAELMSFDKFPAAWGGRAPWPEKLASVRDRIEEVTGTRFQVARCVYYRDGTEGMGFHVDEPAYGSTEVIVSLSLGAEREFGLRSLTDPEDEFRIALTHGSLLYMGKHCQSRYEHALFHSDSCTEPRINLTFRRYGWE
jgi:hypothetical protein